MKELLLTGSYKSFHLQQAVVTKGEMTVQGFIDEYHDMLERQHKQRTMMEQMETSVVVSEFGNMMEVCIY